jgi:hypothetical protein
MSKNIQGRNFSNGLLQNVSFQGVIAGLKPSWFICLHFLAVFLAMVVGIIAAYAGALTLIPTTTDSHEVSTYLAHTLISLTLSFISFATVLLRGIDSMLATGLVILTSIAIAAMAFIPTQIAQNSVSVLFLAMAVIGLITAVFNGRI